MNSCLKWKRRFCSADKSKPLFQQLAANQQDFSFARGHFFSIHGLRLCLMYNSLSTSPSLINISKDLIQKYNVFWYKNISLHKTQLHRKKKNAADWPEALCTNSRFQSLHNDMIVWPKMYKAASCMICGVSCL